MELDRLHSLMLESALVTGKDIVGCFFKNCLSVGFSECSNRCHYIRVNAVWHRQGSNCRRGQFICDADGVTPFLGCAGCHKAKGQVTSLFSEEAVTHILECRAEIAKTSDMG